MKKKSLIIVAVVLLMALLMLFLIIVSINYLLAKAFENPVIASLPKYKDSDCYYSDGFQDYTNYCKYYFTNIDAVAERLKENEYFEPLTQEDVEEVKSYFENFNGWVEYEEYKDKYDFSYDSVDTSDYFYIENKDNYEKYKIYPDKYAAYNVYFFDVQTKTLYFIHNNI